MSDSKTDGFRFRTLLLYLVLVGFAIGVPPLLYAKTPAFVSSTYGHRYLPWELQGFTASAAALAIFFLEIRKRKDKGIEGILPIALIALVFFHYLLWACEAEQQGDFKGIYRGAANQPMAGHNPYGNTGFLYSPVLAQVFAGLFRLVRSGLSTAHMHMSTYDIWVAIFYMFQWAQLGLVICAYMLGVRMVRLLGIRSIWAPLLVAAVFVFNNPAVRTLRMGQVNFWMLAAILLVLTVRGRLAWLSGAALAIGANLKLYPLAMLIPLGISRCWKALAGFAAGLAVLLLLTTHFGTDWTMWRQYLHGLATCPTNYVFRNNALRNFIDLCWHFAVGRHDPLPFVQPMALKLIDVLAALGFVVWAGVRMHRRERYYGFVVKAKTDDASSARAAEIRLFGHAMDLLATAMLVSPMVWEHHYTLAIPIVLYAVVVFFRTQPWLVALGSALMLLPPTFDFFPFSFNRLAGLILVFIAMAPRVDLAEYAPVQMPERMAPPELVGV